jgi:hypothetical protein
MIIVRVTGGLGNQFFQYAVGRSLSSRLGVPLKLDITHYENNPRRQYFLNNFNITGEIATQDEIKKIKPENIINKIAGKVLGIENKYIFSTHVHNEPHYRFWPEALHLPDNSYLDGDGHWQSYKYFTDIENTVRKEFTLKEPLPANADSLMKNIHDSNSVSVHIRRGDYLAPKNQKIFAVCGPAYYEKALSLLKEKVPDATFFVFSDDLEFARDLSFPKDTVYIDEQFGLKDFQECVIMSMCKHTITANSTFSWWAAWLNQNPDKIVTTPKKWFVLDTHNSPDLIPKSWLEIEF